MIKAKRHSVIIPSSQEIMCTIIIYFHLTLSFCLSSSFSALSAFFANDSTSFSCVILSTSDIAVAI